MISFTEQTFRQFRQEAGGEQNRSVRLPLKFKKNKFSNSQNLTYWGGVGWWGEI